MTDHHIHHHSTARHSSVNNYSGVVLGMAIGAAVTYLFVNKDGQKIRELILKEGTKLLGDIAEKADSIQESVQETAIGKEITEKIEDVKKSVDEIEQMVESVPDHIDEIQKKGRRFFFKKPHQNKSNR